MIRRPLSGSHTLLVASPKRDPAPAAKTTTATRIREFIAQLCQTSDMSPRIGFNREKLDPQQKAAKIKAKHALKSKSQGLFTPAQEELMEELGLKGDRPLEKLEVVPKIENQVETPRKKKRDPLSPRQRRLMQELGLTSAISPEVIPPSQDQER
jgi:hypothetical protein